jgi:hypothetical protein
MANNLVEANIMFCWALPLNEISSYPHEVSTFSIFRLGAWYLEIVQ